MAEKHSKSKLKRNKCSTKDLQPASSSLKRSRSAPPSGGTPAAVGAASTSRDLGVHVKPSVWWSGEPLPAEESLWALALKSALPYLEHQHWDLLPDLPHPFAAKPKAMKLDEQRWCDLSKEVAPFPEPSSTSPRTSWNPDPVSIRSSQQGLSLHTKPGPDLSSHSKQSHNSKTTLHQALTKRPQASLYSWERPASSAGPSNVGALKWRTGGEEDAGPVSKRPLANQVTVSNAHVCRQREIEEEVHPSVREGGGEGEAAGGGEEAAAGGEAAGGGEWGGGLQSCPMCLVVFPVGFSQMDCDGHLAQCLSEVNVDMTW